MAQAPPAFAKVAAALLRYQGAFQTARAEAQVAIAEAAAAEQATSLAQSKHQQAVKDAALADPGTPNATPPVYSDPGAAGLATAQARLAAAQTTLLTIGNEVAAEIYAAAGTTSNASPEITDDGWEGFWNSPFGRGPLLHLFPELDPVVSGFLKGFTSAAWDTIVGLNDLIQAIDPTQRLIRDLQNLITGGPDAFLKQYLDDGQALITIGTDPLGALRELWRQISAEDLWATNPAEATGRVTFEILSIVVPIAKIGKVSKLGKLSSSVDDVALRTLKAGETPRIGTLARGSSDGGPGLWAQSPKRTKGVEYQEFITQMERGTEYKVNGINFDGYDRARNVLLDAKNWDKWPPANKSFWHQSTLKELRSQLDAANGTPIEWHLSSQAAKEAVDKMLSGAGMSGSITTIYTPFILGGAR